jgi:hypothetical protein
MFRPSLPAFYPLPRCLFYSALDRMDRISSSFDSRVRKELWYTEPVSRHTIASQLGERRDQMKLPWDDVLHSTRHTALADLGAAGADAFTIQTLAGPASVSTSQKYVHRVPKTMARAMAKLGAVHTEDLMPSRAGQHSRSCTPDRHPLHYPLQTPEAKVLVAAK